MLLLAAATCAALCAQDRPDPADVLNRARFRLANSARLARGIACTETINRTYLLRPRTVDCDKAAADKKLGRTQLAEQATDRVRIQVTEFNQREAHAWPEATRFDDMDIDRLIERGPAATGAFGGYLTDVFANEATQFSFAGARNEGGRQVYAYEFRVDEESSHYKVRTDTGWVTAGFDGGFELDPATLDLLRITLTTLPLPPATGLCEAHSSMEYSPMEYGPMDLGASNGGVANWFLPRESVLRLVFRGTAETNSAASFSGCHEYPGEKSTGVTDSSQRDTGDLKLPPEAKLTAALDAPIDSNTAAAGDVVTATLKKPVAHPLSGQMLVRKGAVIHGRITRMEHWVQEPRMFLIAIHWDSIMQDGTTAPLQAVLSKDRLPIGCVGQHVLAKEPLGPPPPPPGLLLTKRAGEMEGRRPPTPPDLKEALPIPPTPMQRCVVAKGQEMDLVVTSTERKK